MYLHENVITLIIWLVLHDIYNKLLAMANWTISALVELVKHNEFVFPGTQSGTIELF